MWTLQHLLAIAHGIFFFMSAWQGWCPQETWHGPQYQHNSWTVYFCEMGVFCASVLCFFSETLDILDGPWKSTCSFFLFPSHFPTGRFHALAVDSVAFSVTYCWSVGKWVSPSRATGHTVTTKVVSAHPELGQPVGKESLGSCGLHTDSCLQKQLVGLKLRCDSLKGAFHSTDDVRKVSDTITC